MIDFISLAAKLIGQQALNSLLYFLKGNKTDLQRKYVQAFAATVDWYNTTYGDYYGEKNSRFFDYRATETELAKLLFLSTDPDSELIGAIKIEGKWQVPAEVAQAFIQKLRQELSQIRECETVLVDKEKYFALKNIEHDTGDIASDIREIKKKMVDSANGKQRKIFPLDWKKLHAAFCQRKLDRIEIKSVGGSLEGPDALDLNAVFFEPDGGKQASVLAIPELAKYKNSQQWQEVLSQAEALQGQLWHYSQEHRTNPDPEWRIGEEEIGEQLEPIFSELHTIFQQRGKPVNKRNFDAALQTIASRLNIPTEKIITRLQAVFQKTTRREPVLKLIPPPCSALLIGDAGVGKTTLMRKLTMDLFQQLGKNGKSATPVPIFVRLDKLAEFMKEDQSLDEAQQALYLYICYHWKEALACKDDLSPENISQCQLPLQLIFDGLDEIPSAKLREKLIAVSKKLSENKKRHIIITSRPAAVTKSLSQSLEFDEIKLLPLRPDQAPQFVRNFFTSYHFDNLTAVEKDSTAFLDALERSDTAQEFAANCLYLTVMILMHKKHEVLPRKRIELFSALYDMLLSQRKLGPGTGRMADRPVFEYQIPRKEPIIWLDTVYTNLLQEIAFLTHADDDDSVSITVERVLTAIKNQRLSDEIQLINGNKFALEFIDWADQHLGVLVRRGEFWGFSHRSLQEYLTAEHLANFDEAQELKKFWEQRALKKPDRWKEVAPLLFCKVRSKKFLFPYLEAQFPSNIFEAQNPLVISMISDILFDLAEFYQEGGGIKNLHLCVNRALTSRRDKLHDTPQLFLVCGDALGKIDEPKIDPADPLMVPFDMRKKFFDMGSEEHDEEKPIHQVNLSPFWLGKYPVTNFEFAEFMRAGGYEQEKYWFFEHARFGFDGREFLKAFKEKAPRYWLDERFGKKPTTGAGGGRKLVRSRRVLPLVERDFC